MVTGIAYKRLPKKSCIQEIWDFIGFPFRAFLLPENLQEKISLTTLKEERLENVLQALHGKVLDIGCGENELILKYRARGGIGIGADVIKYKNVDVILKNNKLPFKNKEFDVVTIIAALNHIPRSKREEILKEIYRVLKPKGIFITTSIYECLGKICHKLTYWDLDQKERDIDFINEEDFALSESHIKSLLESNGFKYIKKHSFTYNLNRMFIFEKSG